MKVQCCCCKKTRVSDTDWADIAPGTFERISHTYCPDCYEEQVQSLRRAALLESPRVAAAH